MSTKAMRATLQIVTDRLEDSLTEEGLSRAQRESYEHQLGLAREALAEVEAIEKAAKDFDHLSVGDFTWNIRDRVASDRHFKGDTWEHPDVKAFSDAAELMGRIAESAPMTPLYPGVDEP